MNPVKFFFKSISVTKSKLSDRKLDKATNDFLNICRKAPRLLRVLVELPVINFTMEEISTWCMSNVSPKTTTIPEFMAEFMEEFQFFRKQF